MAGNRGLGLNSLTVQEATNKIASYKAITVVPTLTVGSPTAYQAGDPIFNSVEIPNAVLQPGGASLLYGVGVWYRDNEDCVHELLFHSTSGAVLGTVNPGSGSVDISDDDFAALNYLGFIEVQAADTSAASGLMYGYVTPTTVTMPMVLQADPGSTSVYISAFMGSDTPTFASASDINYIFHIKY